MTRCRSHALAGLVPGVLAFVLGACAPEPPQLAPSGAAFARQVSALTVCADGATVPGVDVSYWQGSIDWSRVAASGIRFGIARVAHGSDFDTVFAANWAGMRTNGIVRGAYVFYEPLNDLDAQVDLVIDNVGRLGDGDLPVTIDIEWPHDGGDPVLADLRDMMSRIEAGTGKRPMIYTARGYWNSYFTNEFATHDLWVANWNVDCPLMPAGWERWTFWQTTGGGGDVPGIAGGVDTDVFNGPQVDLEFVANVPADAHCSLRRALECHRQGCACTDDACAGGLCAGHGCTAAQEATCAAAGCACVDGRCAGGACAGNGCTEAERQACVTTGCGCIDHACSAGNCPGSGCTAAQEAACAADGCACAEGRCSGGQCPGTGCTSFEQRDCAEQDCGCVDHVCSGGACAGSGCTAAQEAACAAVGAACLRGVCATESACAGVAPLPADICWGGRRYHCDAAGVASEIAPLVETCNGQDDDCDGAVDNDFGVGGPCTAGTGACAFAGVTACALSGAGTVCVPAHVPCDDGNPCTLDSCDPAVGCLSSPTLAWCDDGDPCTVNDWCSGGRCMPGAPSADPACAGGPDAGASPDAGGGADVTVPPDGAPGDSGGPLDPPDASGGGDSTAADAPHGADPGPGGPPDAPTPDAATADGGAGSSGGGGCAAGGAPAGVAGLAAAGLLGLLVGLARARRRLVALPTCPHRSKGGRT